MTHVKEKTASMTRMSAVHQRKRAFEIAETNSRFILNEHQSSLTDAETPAPITRTPKEEQLAVQTVHRTLQELANEPSRDLQDVLMKLDVACEIISDLELSAPEQLTIAARNDLLSLLSDC